MTVPIYLKLISFRKDCLVVLVLVIIAGPLLPPGLRPGLRSIYFYIYLFFLIDAMHAGSTALLKDRYQQFIMHATFV